MVLIDRLKLVGSSQLALLEVTDNLNLMFAKSDCDEPIGHGW